MGAHREHESRLCSASCTPDAPLERCTPGQNALALFQAEAAWCARVCDYSRRSPDGGFWSPGGSL